MNEEFVHKQVAETMREVYASNGAHFGTSVPHSAISEVKVIKIGFADIPVCYVAIGCRDQDHYALVEIARSTVYKAIKAADLPIDALAFTALCSRERDHYKFEDVNESSQSFGKNKIGSLYHFSFEITPAARSFFEFDGRYGKIRQGAG